MKHVAEDAEQAAPLESRVLQPNSRAYSICAWAAHALPVDELPEQTAFRPLNTSG